MAASHRVNLTNYAPLTGIFEVQPLKDEILRKASEILQQNHDNYHIYIHNLGLHNHILHHILALVALGGTEPQLELAYNLNTDSQKSTRPPDPRRVLDFAQPANFRKYLGKGDYYDDYFAFFQDQISRHGLAVTVNEFLFKGHDRAEDMFQRFFSGFLHSPIHLGYAIEFDQPLIAAEALAMTAVHDNSFGLVLTEIERYASRSSSNETLITLQRKMHENHQLRGAMDYKYGVKQVRDGFLAHTKDTFMELIGSWKVQSHELEEKTAECLNSTLYWTALAQRPEKQIRFDFFLMHSITAGSLWPAFNSVSWISERAKCRLLEWKGRADLMLYCQVGLPAQQPEELLTYRPQYPSGWSEVFKRACDYKDDGHLAKFIRGIATAYQISKPFVSKSHFSLKTEEQFLQIAHMVIDSAEKFNLESADRETEMICVKYGYPRIMSPEIQRVTARWPRHVGFEEAWFHVPARKSNMPRL
ncbi:uncharacterized protein N7483_009926 [Penicillium malachiteum]|uniref:uncharacterized protein n=1 Tax=Penicillium malachiteum TaxID=1324776 RepID=UPI00254859BE|nr:uncharacterized protein N7483_009926 [Penicillium malachiteum]KAJ5718844.1 hypothetical protein N7483_009926 [Penicillium malachiteum]